MASAKEVPQDVLDAFTFALKRWVKESFDENQSRAGETIGLTQSHISALIRGTKRPGLATLLALREASGKTIDEWLGFPPPPTASETILRRLRDALDRELALIRAEESSKPSQ